MFDKEAISALQEGTCIKEAVDAITCAVNGSAVVALPEKITLRDLEGYMQNRRRARGVMKTNNIESFAQYTTAHKEEGAAVFVDQKDMSASAVLNLGTPGEPGHTDNLAVLRLEKTAAYKALTEITGLGKTQKEVAEFLEDWADYVKCYGFTEEGQIAPEIKTSRAISAIRKITIESMRKMESSEQALGASKSAFESVQATSVDPLPVYIEFRCVPYPGIELRTFLLRLSVLTGDDKPKVTLRIIKAEQHQEAMADELAASIKDVFDGDVAEKLPVMIGEYARST